MVAILSESSIRGKYLRRDSSWRKGAGWENILAESKRKREVFADLLKCDGTHNHVDIARG